MAKKINIALILSLMCANSFAKYPEDVFSSPVGDLTVDTFPPTDCSDSTAPLRNILVFKLFGCPYAWERDGYAQYEWQHPWGISFGDYEYYTEHGIDKLKRNRRYHAILVLYA